MVVAEALYFIPFMIIMLTPLIGAAYLAVAVSRHPRFEDKPVLSGFIGIFSLIFTFYLVSFTIRFLGVFI